MHMQITEAQTENPNYHSNAITIRLKLWKNKIKQNKKQKQTC